MAGLSLARESSYKLGNVLTVGLLTKPVVPRHDADLEVGYLWHLGLKGDQVPVVAVDASSTIVGMSGGHPMEAIRAAIVVRCPGESPRVMRFGPYLTSYSSENESMLELEDFAKVLALQQISGGIVLLDGLVLSDERQMVQTEGGRATNNNVIVSITKKFMSSRLLNGAEDQGGRLVGKIRGTTCSYLLKLGSEPIILKADIYPEMSPWQVRAALDNLLKSDEMHMAYPNTLRLSHIYSKILFAEGLALQKLALREKGIVMSPVINDRKIILGSMWS